MLYTRTKWCRMLVFVLALTVLMALPMSAAYPKHSDYVYDKENVLSGNTVSALKDTNTRLLSGRGVIIAVCVTDSTDGESIGDFSRSLFKEWNIANGVLLVIDTEAKDYYAVPSMDIDDVLNNDRLITILSGYMESEFAEGNVDRGVYKTILKLDEFLTAELPVIDNGDSAQIGNASDDKQDKAEETEEASGFVKVLKGIFTFLLVLGILVVVLVGGLFVAALFNDTAMDLFQTYIMGMLLRKNVAPSYQDNYGYDDRLYNTPAVGNGRQNRRNTNEYGEYNEYSEYGEYGTDRRQNNRQNASAGRAQSYDAYTQPRRAKGQNTGRQNREYYDIYAGQDTYGYPQQKYSRQQDNRYADNSGQYRVRNNARQNKQQQYYDDYR